MNTSILAFCNHKGGVGKTTSVVSIGSVLAQKGYKVLLIDMDAQANLTFALTDGEESRSTYNALKERKDIPQIAVTDNLYLCPSSLDLAAIEAEIAGTIGRERALERALAPLRGCYDFILIDCAPSLG
jgi:chromosome partitioning protein